MKAVVYNQYGSPDVLRLADVDPPTVGEDRVLVRVRAASINSWDWDELRGFFLARVGAPRTPKREILGGDIAGVVEKVGSAVTDLSVGDEVFGDNAWFGMGGFAELAAVPARALASKPADLTFEQAAAIPQAGVLALQGLSKKPSLGPGLEVLVNGAGGGVGTFAVQIASKQGATVTAVDKAGKLDKVRSLGAKEVVDYEQDDYTRAKGRYDLIIDPVGRRSIFANRWALSAQGEYVMIGGSFPRLLQVFAMGPILSREDGRQLGVLRHRVDRDDMIRLGEMVTKGDIKPIIDSVFALDAVPDAFQHYLSGEFVGKIVIRI